jgi:hypothetical protein
MRDQELAGDQEIRSNAFSKGKRQKAEGRRQKCGHQSASQGYTRNANVGCETRTSALLENLEKDFSSPPVLL